MSSEGYKEIVEQHLAPYMANFHEGRCRLLQDNAPTHVTDLTYEALHENNINWVWFFMSYFVGYTFSSKI